LLGSFEDVAIRFAVGRYVRWHPRLMANVQVFSAVRPGTDRAARDDARASAATRRAPRA
jgi:hypothetical protein